MVLRMSDRPDANTKALASQFYQPSTGQFSLPRSMTGRAKTNQAGVAKPHVAALPTDNILSNQCFAQHQQPDRDSFHLDTESLCIDFCDLHCPQPVQTT